MNQKFKSAGLAALISAFACASQAQTNQVESLAFSLTAFYQGTPVTTVNHHVTNVTQNVSSVRIGTTDIISLLGKATTNTFSSAAQLLRITPILNGTNGPVSFIVRDKSAKATNIVDVTGFFEIADDSTTVTNTTSTNGVVITDTLYSVKTLSLVDRAGDPPLTAHLKLHGFVVAPVERDLFKDGLISYGAGATWTVTGTGDRNGVPGVIDGNAAISTVSVSLPKFVVGPGY